MAGTYIQILSPMFLAQAVASPTGGMLDVLERQDLHLSREVGRIVILLSAAALVYFLRLPAIGAVAAVSVAGTLCYSWYATTGYLAVRSIQSSLAAEQAGE
jgi:hypothetical protein